MFVQVAPSILSADFAALGHAVEKLTQSGADLIHIDVMDGRFVPNLTIGPPVIAALRKHTTLPFDVHLMIEDPDRSIDLYRDAGADIITVHAEATLHLQRTLYAIRESGARAGLALSPATPPHILDYVLSDLDMVLIMTVNPGFGGQSFLPSMLHKISAVRKKLSDAGYASVPIEVDGGIHPHTAANCVSAGASVLVSGSYLFESPSMADAISTLRGK